MQLHPGSQTVARAAALLDLYTPERRELSVADAAEALTIGKSAAHRLLSTLRDCGYLRQDRATSRYALGAKVLLLGDVYRLDRDLPRIALPHMQRLLREINESVGLYVREGDARYCIAQLESSHDIRVVIRVGQRMPLGRGAAGRLLVMTDAQAREAGAIITRGERVPNACGIAAGIFNASGELIAALDVSGPLDRVTEAAARGYAELLVAAAANLSAEFRYRRTLPSE
jgi:DNA-binding IclR family transcriptional regulator